MVQSKIVHYCQVARFKLSICSLSPSLTVLFTSSLTYDFSITILKIGSPLELSWIVPYQDVLLFWFHRKTFVLELVIPTNDGFILSIDSSMVSTNVGSSLIFYKCWLYSDINCVGPKVDPHCFMQDNYRLQLYSKKCYK